MALKEGLSLPSFPPLLVLHITKPAIAEMPGTRTWISWPDLRWTPSRYRHSPRKGQTSAPSQRDQHAKTNKVTHHAGEAIVAVALISPPEGGASIPTLLYFYYSIGTPAAEAARTTIIIIIPSITAGTSSRILHLR